jgi:hypothetical protein
MRIAAASLAAVVMAAGCGSCEEDSTPEFTESVANAEAEEVEPRIDVEFDESLGELPAPGSPAGAPPAEEGPVDSIDDVWLGLRIGPHTYALTDHSGSTGRPAEGTEEIGHVVHAGLGRVQPMRFYAQPLDVESLPAATVLAPGAVPCIATANRALKLIAWCDDERDGWGEAWTALELDCVTTSHENVVVRGSHPEATLVVDGFAGTDVSFREIPVPDDIPDMGVFRAGRRIASVPGPAYDTEVLRLTVGGEDHAILATGYEGYGRFLASTAPRLSGSSRESAYPAVTCGAF